MVTADELERSVGVVMSSRSLRVWSPLLAVAGILAVIAASAFGAGARSRLLAGDTGRGPGSGITGSPGLRIPTAYSRDGSAANRAAAHRDARSSLAKVLLPIGAVQLGSEPPGDSGDLKPLQVLEGNLAHAVAWVWWEVPGTSSALIAYVESHPPAGSTEYSTGGLENSAGGMTAWTVSFRWPAITNVLGDRTVAVTATALGDGETGVLVEAQSDCVVLRSWSERIPSMTREIQITSGAPGSPPAIALLVTRAAEMRRIVGLINALPIAQRVVYACPALTDPRVITISFRAATGARLATLTYMDFRPWAAPSIGCKTIGLTIGGRRERSLIGGYFLRTLATLIGRSLI